MSWPAVHKHKFGLKFCFSTLSFERFDRETPSKFCIKQYYLPFTMNGISPCSVHIIIDSKQFPYLVDPKIIKL